MERRYEIMAELSRGFREKLSSEDPAAVANRCGAFYDPESALISLPVFTQQCAIRVPGYLVTEDQSGPEWSPWLQNMVLMHLVTASGAPLHGRWVTLREIPDGRNYSQAVQSYAADRLVKHVANDLSTLRRSCSLLGAWPLDIGDAGFSFQAFPRLPVGLIYWMGDEEFPPSATILFDARARDYLPTDALAVLGNWLCSMLIEACDAGALGGSFQNYPFADLDGA